jgi:hypothetical protein
MRTHNPENERIKRAYLIYLKEARRLGEHSAGLPYANPHSFRKTLVQIGERLCHTPEEFKAWSQNLGHEQPGRCLSSVASLASARSTLKLS